MQLCKNRFIYPPKEVFLPCFLSPHSWKITLSLNGSASRWMKLGSSQFGSLQATSMMCQFSYEITISKLLIAVLRKEKEHSVLVLYSLVYRKRRDLQFYTLLKFIYFFIIIYFHFLSLHSTEQILTWIPPLLHFSKLPTPICVWQTLQLHLNSGFLVQFTPGQAFRYFPKCAVLFCLYCGLQCMFGMMMQSHEIEIKITVPLK